MPIRAYASRAFTGCRAIAQFWMTDEAMTIVLIMQQRHLHCVVAALKPHLKRLVAHCSSLPQRAFALHAVSARSHQGVGAAILHVIFDSCDQSSFPFPNSRIVAAYRNHIPFARPEERRAPHYPPKLFSVNPKCLQN
jgi:hypothetical protein